MNRKEQFIEPDNSYYRPSTDSTSGTMTIVVIMTILFVVLTAVLAIFFFTKSDGDDLLEGSPNQTNALYIAAATPTPTPIPDISLTQNPILYPASATCTATISEVTDEADPLTYGITQTVLGSEAVGTISDYNRANPIHFNDPLYYGQVSGILTFRGNNFRNCSSFGYVNISEGTLTQVWEYSGIGSLLSSTYSFEWSGVAWTGQPLVVSWGASERAAMNLYPEKASKTDLVEVIVAGLDGKIYFFDLDDGSFTRDPIDVGYSIKGTPAVDPRGYPLLYVGQCDDNSADDDFGMYIYSLIDGSELYYCSGVDDRAYRSNWGAFDSSPIVDATTDTLIWPGENGIIYTFTLNTQYVVGSGNIQVNPEMIGYKYIYADGQGAYMGVESSIAVYGGYGYFVDNAHNLNCLDLNTMQMVWTFKLGDDSDITPTIEEEAGIPYIYVGTEVDDQNGTGESIGASYIYKINGLSGEQVWQTSATCYTYNGDSSDTDQSGGCFGNPIIGKRNMSNLVIFSFSMTNGVTSGNRIVAYDKETGIEVWSYDMNIYSYSSPVDCYDENGNGYIVIADSLGQIHLVNGQTGERITYIQMSRLTGTSEETTSGIIFDASPVIYGNMLIIGSKSGSIFAVRIG